MFKMNTIIVRFKSFVNMTKKISYNIFFFIKVDNANHGNQVRT